LLVSNAQQVGLNGMLRLQQLADGWYLVGLVGNEMDQHFGQTEETITNVFRAKGGQSKIPNRPRIQRLS
jgi:hypothetical protein